LGLWGGRVAHESESEMRHSSSCVPRPRATLTSHGIHVSASVLIRALSPHVRKRNIVAELFTPQRIGFGCKWAHHTIQVENAVDPWITSFIFY
jgi:hypothetical protein